MGGIVTKWQCSDTGCNSNCAMTEHHEKDFEVCRLGKSGYYQTFHCEYAFPIYDDRSYQFSMLRYDKNDPTCSGDPIDEKTSGQCYRDSSNPCDLRYYRFKCHPSRGTGDELRQLTDEDGVKIGIVDNINIVVAVLLIVWIIGAIVGYFMYKKKKKLSEQRKRILTVTSRATNIN